MRYSYAYFAQQLHLQHLQHLHMGTLYNERFILSTLDDRTQLIKYVYFMIAYPLWVC